MNATAGLPLTMGSAPFELSLRYLTDPYARGAATLPLTLNSATAGTSTVAPYGFDTVQTRFGLQSGDLACSYVLTLRADQLSGPAKVEIDYDSAAGAGTVRMIIPAGALAGTSYVVAPLPGNATLVLRRLRETPAPAVGQPSGPDKFALTVLLGHVARLCCVLSGEDQLAAATARYVRGQRHLASAAGASLDRIGESLRVPRLPPAPYRLDLDPDTVALYHLDDTTAPVFDATHDYPGVNVGAKRGIPGKFGNAYQITPTGGLIIPDSSAFDIDPTAGFTVEMFVNLAAAPAAGERVVFAAKRPRFDQLDSPGWALALEPSGANHDLAFTLTDTAGTVVRAAATNVVLPAGWFHIAGVIDPATNRAQVFLNGQSIAIAFLGELQLVKTGANVGLGSDSVGVARLNGSLDEVRVSRVARTNFSSVLGPGAAPYVADDLTIALYHLDETDDWIDEDGGQHFAINSGGVRAVAARFGGGLRFLEDSLPQPHCPAERDFQNRLRAGAWDRTRGGARVDNGLYGKFGYRQGAISEPGFDGALHPVIINDKGLMTTACYGFAPDDPLGGNDPSQTIAKFQAANRSVQEAIDYFGEWHGLDDGFFTTQYQAHGITATREACQPAMVVPSSARIETAGEFAFDAATSFTIEAYIQPDAVSDDYPRAVIASRSSALFAGDANVNEAGWALCLGRYHSIPNNLRWVVGDASGNLAAVEADMDLSADGAFHHIAGVVDRLAGVARLYVDGAEVGQAMLGQMGAAATAGPITMGNCPKLNAPCAGLLDEVRISSAARRSFEPALGEGDARYRQRLAIYQPWRLPVYPTISRLVQILTLSDPSQVDLVDLLLGDDRPPPELIQFDVDETDSTRFGGSRWFRIIPEALAIGDSIAADGKLSAKEPSAEGLVPLAGDDPALVSVADGTNYVFTDPDPASTGRRMRLATVRALETLAARLLVLAPAAKLTVWGGSYLPPGAGHQGAVPASNDNLGRAFTIFTASGIDIGVLGALAFETGITYVARPNARSLRLVVAPGDDLDVVVIGPGNHAGLDLDNRQIVYVNQSITLAVMRPRPTVRSGLAANIEWSVLPTGPAAATLTSGGDPSRATLTAVAPGTATVQVRYTLSDGVTVLSGGMPIVIAPRTLGACATMDGKGTPDVGEAASSGPPDEDFRADYLVTVSNPTVDFAVTTAPASSRRMQLPLETALGRLAGLAAGEPGAPRITVLSAYDPNVATLQAVGRGMIVHPSSSNLSAGRLAALAFLAGFSYIERRRYPPSVYVSVPMGDRFEIVSGPVKRLWRNARISGRGRHMATEFEAAGPPEPSFDPAGLIAFTDARVTFDNGASNKMQPSLSVALTKLLNALDGDGVGGLHVTQGFFPQDPSLLRVGRALLARSDKVASDRLCGYALLAGFDFVEHRTDQSGSSAYMAAYRAGDAPLDLLSAPEANANYVNLYRDSLVELNIRPQLPIKGQLDWVVQAACPASAELSTALVDAQNQPGITAKILRGLKPGAVTAIAAFSLRDFSEPYQYRILPAAKAKSPRLSKDQYDDLLNFLDAFHPAGCEAVTRPLRQFVHGFRRPSRWDRLPTSATFSRYRTNT